MISEALSDKEKHPNRWRVLDMASEMIEEEGGDSKVKDSPFFSKYCYWKVYQWDGDGGSGGDEQYWC